MTPTPLFSIRGLVRHFPGHGGLFQRAQPAVAAVANIDFDIRKGETVGLIGQSGSGKSTVARLITGLDRPDEGSIAFEGRDLLALDERTSCQYRKRIQMVPQDSSASLNPRKRIGPQIADPMLRFGTAANRDAARTETRRLLKRVGLSESDAERFPHEFSGGQRQRINIARALGVKADFLVLDEPTSALDVSIQAHILDLLRELKAERDLTYLFIGHNLAVVQSFCERILVMEQGVIVDNFPSAALGHSVRHPATRRLVEAILPIHA